MTQPAPTEFYPFSHHSDLAQAPALSSCGRDALKDHERDMLDQISHIDTQVFNWQSSIQEAKAKRAELEKSIACYRELRVKMIVQTIPHDILAEIFMWCSVGLRELPLLSFSDGAIGREASRWISPFKLKEPPWTLTYVCHKWREAALSTPLLWSHLILFDPSRHNAMNLPWGASNLLQVCLDRSQKLPLVINMGVLNTEVREFWSLTRALFQHDYRIVALDVASIRSSKYSKIFGQYSGPKFPNLRTLVVHGAGAHSIPQWMVRATEEAADLRQLVVAPTTFTPGQTPTHLSERLTHLTLGHISSPAYDAASSLIILAMTPNLTSLKCGLVRKSTSTTTTLLRLAQLAILEVASNDSVTDIFLSRLELPALRNLKCLSNDSLEGIECIVGTSHPPITSLCVNLERDSSNLNFIDILSSLPELVSLDVEMASNSPTSPFLQALIVQNKKLGNIICPRLENIALSWQKPEFSANIGAIMSLLDLVHFRANKAVTACLSSVSLSIFESSGQMSNRFSSAKHLNWNVPKESVACLVSLFSNQSIGMLKKLGARVDLQIYVTKSTRGTRY